MGQGDASSIEQHLTVAAEVTTPVFGDQVHMGSESQLTTQTNVPGECGVRLVRSVKKGLPQDRLRAYDPQVNFFI